MLCKDGSREQDFVYPPSYYSQSSRILPYRFVITPSRCASLTDTLLHQPNNAPTMLPTSRPQTLKQAKRAYRKSGASVRLSASELAQAERRAVCQERADRIKEREARRKANLKKREEKIARERNTAHLIGKPFTEEKKGGWKVGASQLDLGRFLGGVQKPGKEEEVIKEPPIEEDGEKQQAEGDKENHKPVASPGEKKMAATTNLMGPPAKPMGQPVVRDFARPLLQYMSPNSASRRKPHDPPKQAPSLLMMDGAFDDCFPSNTQIERELSPSPPEPKLIRMVSVIQKPPKSPIQATNTPPNEEANDLLAGISTQDLDFSEEITPLSPQEAKQEDADVLAQISTQDLDFEDELAEDPPADKQDEPEALLAQISTQDLEFSDDSQPEAKLSEAEYNDDVTDHDLENLAMELNSSAEAIKRAKEEEQKKQQAKERTTKEEADKKVREDKEGRAKEGQERRTRENAE